MKRLKHGDIFAIPLGSSRFLSGRILLDVKGQCFKPKLVDNSSPLGFYNGTLLVEIFSQIHDRPEARLSPALIASIFVGRDRFTRGDWPIVGHIPVDPERVEFPEAIGSFGMYTHLMRGEVMFPLCAGITGWQGIAINPKVCSEFMLPSICLCLLGYADEVDPRMRRWADLANYDLRYHARRREIYSQLSLNPDEPYAALALRSGFDLTRFYRS